jgi:hypothetical protein
MNSPAAAEAQAAAAGSDSRMVFPDGSGVFFFRPFLFYRDVFVSIFIGRDSKFVCSALPRSFHGHELPFSSSFFFPV